MDANNTTEQTAIQAAIKYFTDRAPMNSKCTCYNTNHKNHCSWTVFHDECNEYKTEED